MRNHYSKDIRKYIRTTKRLIACPRKYRRKILDDIELDIKQFIKETPSAGSPEVVGYFDTPEKLAQTYLDSVPHEELVKHKYKRRYRFTISLIVLIFFFAIVSIFLYYQFNTCKVIYIEEEIEILDEDKE